MDDQLWNLFRETGEPMGYLLYRAEKNTSREKDAEKPAPKPEGEPPSVSA